MSLHTVINGATSFLFVPGNRPERFQKAHESGTDIVIIDLEDAVATAEKAQARANVRTWLLNNPTLPTVVRINPRTTPAFEEDVQALAGLARAVMLPKAETPEDIAETVATLGDGILIVALIETAKGVLNAPQIAASPRVARLAFGNVDFAADVQIKSDDNQAQLFARSQLVLACAASQIAGPIDGVTTNILDESVTLHAAEYARSLGFTGKLCVHPRQVAPVRRAYLPTEDEIAWATAIVQRASDSNVATIDGQMIDRPVVLRAEQILAQAAHATLN
ncbi:HpcH/HpaI aldolase/citrate lyase family protein [Pseudomonas sp. NPDC090592]|uniref:HpcH/HpaI aldolase/citrate lyase family protein n=1 Tax=Pseudomonas sp. NPDC090592 TaxID=3364480 RepID=UPI00383AE4C3